jgi:hypothetical protein
MRIDTERGPELALTLMGLDMMAMAQWQCPAIIGPLRGTGIAAVFETIGADVMRLDIDAAADF